MMASLSQTACVSMRSLWPHVCDTCISETSDVSTLGQLSCLLHFQIWLSCSTMRLHCNLWILKICQEKASEDWRVHLVHCRMISGWSHRLLRQTESAMRHRKILFKGVNCDNKENWLCSWVQRVWAASQLRMFHVNPSFVKNKGL